MRLRHAVSTLAALAALAAPAAGAEPAPPAAAWAVARAAEGGAVAVRPDGDAVAAEGRCDEAWRAERPLDGTPGSDQAPLVLRAVLGVSGRRAQAVLPTVLAVRWGDGAELALGLPPADQPQRERGAWAAWKAEGRSGQAVGRQPFLAGEGEGHLRVVLTGRVVAAECSRDGVAWERLLELPRQGALTAAPAALAVGRWAEAGEERRPGRKERAEQGAWRFSGIAAEALPDRLPAALLKDYRRPDSYEAAREQDEDAGLVRSWRVAGPLDRAARDAAEADPGGPAWSGVELPAGRDGRTLDLTQGRPAPRPQALYLAACRISADAPRYQLLRCEGGRQLQLLVNGREVARAQADDGARRWSRLAVAVPLRTGDNLVVARVAADERGIATLSLRSAPADPRSRIARLGRLALDFPAEPEAQVEGRREIARLWEEAGHLRAAADALGELAALPDLPGDEADRAQSERARLLHRLGDQEGVTALVRSLEQRWAEAGGGSAARLTAARLWDGLGRGAEAVSAVSAVVADPATPAEERVELALERVRLAEPLGPAAAAEACASAAALLPAADPRHALLLAEAARRDPARLAAAPPSARLAGVLAGQESARGAALDRLAAARPLSPAAILRAEGQAAGDGARAAALYRAAIAAAGGQAPAGADLPVLRRALFLALLAGSAPGRGLADALGAAGAAGPAAALGDIADWQVCGPFPAEAAMAAPPCDPAAPPAGAVAGRPWKKAGTRGQDGVLDLGRVLGDSREAALCSASIEVPAAGEAVLFCGSDDGLALWLNGERVFEEPGLRGLVRDQFAVPVRFRAGANRLLAVVHNGGGGGWALQVRPQVGSFPGAALASLAEALGAAGAGRAAAADQGRGLVEQLVRANRIDEAAALAAALGVALADQAERLAPAALAVLGAAPEGAGRSRLAVAAWCEEAEDLALPVPALPGDWRPAAAERLLADGDGEGALALLGRALAGEFRREQRAALLAGLGGALLRHGLGTPARRHLAAARDLAPADPGLRERIAQQLAVLRSWQGEWPRIDGGQELVGRIDAADRAAAGDPAAGAEALGRLVEEQGERLWAVGERTWQPVAWWAQRRMAEGGPALLAAWRAAQGARADAALAGAAASPPAVRERLVARWPFAAGAAPALLALAEDQLDRDWRALALATAGQALALPGAAGDPALALRALRLAVLCGDADAAARWRALAGGGSPALAAVLALPALPPAAGAATAGAAALPRRAAWIAAWQPSALELRHLAAAGGRDRAAVRPAPLPAGVALALGDGVALLDAASGAVRWRSAVASGGPPPPFAGAPERGVAQAGAILAARVLEGGRWRLQGLRAADGRLRWSSAGQQALADLDAVSDPAVCGDALAVLMAGRSTLQVAVLDAASGELRRLADLPAGRQQPAGGGWEAPALNGHLPAPLVDGRTAFIDTGGGLVAAFDIPAGRLLWLSAYPRTVVGEGSRLGAAALLRRAASAPVRAGAVVVAAPRDSLALAAFDAASGAPRWRRDRAAAERMLAAGAGALLLQGEEIELVDAADGATRWRWRPAAGPALGAAAGADAVLAASAAGIHRLRLADGAEEGLRSWADLGLERPAAGLALSGGRLLACGPDRLAALSAEPGPAPARIALPAAPPAAGAAHVEALAPGEGTVGVAWFRPGIRVEEAVAAGDDCLVRSEGALERIALADGALRWRLPIPGGAVAVLDPAHLAVVHRGWFARIDAASGAVLAQGQVDPDPARLFEDNPWRTVRASGGWLTMLRPDWNQPVLAVRLADGRTTRLGGPAMPLAAMAVDGRLRVLAQQDNRVWLREHDPLTGAALGAQAMAEGLYGQVVQWPQRARWCLGQRGRALDLFDLEARTRTALDPGERARQHLGGLWTWNDGGRLGLGARHAWDSAFAGGIDPAAGTVELRPVHRLDPGRIDPRLAQRALRFGDGDAVILDREPPGKGWRSGVSYAVAGAERWFWSPDADRHGRHLVALLPWGDRLVAISRGADERLLWHALDAAGKEHGSGPLPGWIAGPTGCTAPAGARWLVGTGEGLVCLARCGGGGLQPQAVAAQALALADPAALDAAIPLAGDAGASLRLGCAEGALVLSVELPGGGPGDELLVGADALGWQAQRAGGEQPPVWRISLDDGRTRVVRSGGAEVAPVAARAAWSPAGMRYEVVLPWPAIVGEAGASRPSGLALGVAATAGGRRAELGRGLLGGFAPHAWATVEWPAAPRTRPKGR